MAAQVVSPEVTVIRPTKGWASLRLRELWAYRELILFLVWRDVKVRYKQTVLGAAWAVIQPLVMALVLTVISALAAQPTGDAPRFLVYYTAMLPWNLFAKGLTEGSNSLVANQRMITKIYFPRLVLPISPVLAGLVDFAIGLAVLVGFLAYYGIWPTVAVVSLPLFILVAILSAMGIAFWFSAIDVRYRDVRYAVPLLTQIWFLATVFVPLSSVPESFQWLYSLNPMVGVVEGFRWALLGDTWSLDPIVWLSMAIVVVIFVGGLFYFRRAERVFADMV